MPEKERNALAELAEKLEADADVLLAYKEFIGDKEDEVGGMVMSDLRKAQRIVAELAKVVDCKEPERIMPLDKPYDDIDLYAPYDNGMTESNSVDEDEKRFIFDLANSAWKCREIAEEGEAK